jgi:hypothetical protein
MPYPELPLESSLPELGSALRAQLAHPALLEFLRRSLQIRELGCAFGLPRRLSARAFQRWLAAPHVRVALADRTQFDGTFCEVALPPEQAVELVDRVLGGSGRAGVPGKVGLPTAAECGVLAYFAARCARACEADLRVQDVHCQASALDPAEAVVWPLRITAREAFELDLKLIFASRERCPLGPLSARIALLDTLEGELMVEVGDLLVSDQWALHATSAGPSGLLELTIAGSSERALLALDGGVLRVAQGEPRPPKGNTAELAIATFGLSFGQLAELLDGESMPCPALDEATLLRRGRPVARGRLVRFQGQVALEVTSTHSMR